MNRRQFIRTTSRSATAIAGAGLVLPAFAQPIKSTGDPVRLGLIGAGGRGAYLSAQMLEHADARFEAICDVHQPRMEGVAAIIEKTQKAKIRQHTDFRRLLDQKGLDGVVVATPHHWHAPIALHVLDSGRHAYVEKPASHVFAEGRVLVEAARRNKVFLQHGTQMRSSEVTEAAAKVLASGQLGEIKIAKAWGVEPRNFPAAVPDSTPPKGFDWNTWLGPAPERPYNENRHRRWNNFRDYGNGEIGGDGIHDIDMALWGLGVQTHPVRITAHGSRIHVKGETEFPDNMMVNYQYAENKVLIYENRNIASYRMHGYDNGNVFYGTKGYMIFSRRGYFQTFLGANDEKGPGMKGSDGVSRHVKNFADAIRGNTRLHTSAEIAHLSCGLVHLGEVAFRAGGVIDFDPNKEQVMGNDRANGMLTKDYRGDWMG